MTTTSAYAIGVTITSDASGFGTGTDAAAAELASLSTAADTAEASVNASFDSIATGATTALGPTGTVPTAVDAGAVNLTTKASKFKAVGTQLGEVFSSGVASGVSAPEAATQVGSAATGLLAPLAATGAGAIAAVGIGLGLAVVSNIVKGARESKQEAIDAFNSIFESIEVNAEDSARKVREAILEAFTFEQAVKDFGGGSIEAGMERIAELAEASGESFAEVAELIQTGINPATQDTATALQKVNDEGSRSVVIRDQAVQQETEIAALAADALGTAEDTTEEQNRLVDAKIKERNTQREINSGLKANLAVAKFLEQSYANMAQQLERSANAAANLNANIQAANGRADTVV